MCGFVIVLAQYCGQFSPTMVLGSGLAISCPIHDTTIIFMFYCSYFVDVRLYKRAKSIADPFAFEQYKKKKIREKIEQERPSRIKIEDNLPKVNRDLASKLMDVEGKKKKKQTGDLLKDERFKVLTLIFSEVCQVISFDTIIYYIFNHILGLIRESRV